MNDTLLKNATQRYDIDPTQLTPLTGGHVNHVYGFTRDGRDYVLRITPPNDEIDVPATRAILTWMRFLAEHGASVSRPVLSQHEHLIERIPADGADYVITAQEKAPGILGEEIPFDQWTPTRIECLGQTVGKLHAVAQTYVPPAPTLARPHWDEIGNCYHPLEKLPASEAIVAQKMRDVVTYVQTLSQDRASYGMIHADLHGGNFFVDIGDGNATITIFDFDDCAYGWYAMDVAMSLFDALVLYPGTDKVTFAEHFLRHYLRGYATEKTLDAYWLAQLPYFLKLLEIGIYTQVFAFHNPTDTTSWVGRFMVNRKHRIEHDIPYTSDTEGVGLDFARLAT